VDRTTPERSSPAAGTRHHGSPEGKIIGAFEPSALDGLIPALVEAGFAEDQIDVVTAEDIPHLDAPIDRHGFTGTIARFFFSLGDELDELEQMRYELRSGHILVGVPVHGDEAVQSVRVIMRERGGHGIVSFGRWTVTQFEEN
jgi:hypothetical protein